MKNIKILAGLIVIFALLTSCEDFIDLKPESYLSEDNYYTNYDQINTALLGCLGGMRDPLNFEWKITEVRTDNARQAASGSTSTPNLELNDLDMYSVSTEHPQVYNYWYAVYKNIYNVNLVLKSLGVKYNPESGINELVDINISMDSTQRMKLAGEALFIRSYHYFNLVRLFGGVFMITEPITPPQAKKINRSSADDIYKLILADLQMSTSVLGRTRYVLTSNELGRPSLWASEALLAKVYLTLGDKTSAIPLLGDIILNSGHTLLANYADVFSITNEMNAEIIFAVRYKAGGLGMGSPFANLFAATNSGSSIISGDGSGLNYPTNEFNATFLTTDLRKTVTLGVFVGGKYPIWVKKFFSPVSIKGDAENDWPILRYSDVLLMMAEAQGYPGGITYINKTRVRAGLGDLPATVNNQTLFEVELLKERRFELAFENHRFFDLVRLNALIPTVKAYFASEYNSFYAAMAKNLVPLAVLQARVTAETTLLPIPQREIDTNNEIAIIQNPGY
ncbi:MAG: RagB/SusD family nutrient uptake outer membrane protein [Tenuifilaceae bacterium]